MLGDAGGPPFTASSSESVRVKPRSDVPSRRTRRESSKLPSPTVQRPVAGPEKTVEAAGKDLTVETFTKALREIKYADKFGNPPQSLAEGNHAQPQSVAVDQIKGGKSAADVGEALLHDVETHLGNNAHYDDMCLVVIRRNGG